MYTKDVKGIFWGFSLPPRYLSVHAITAAQVNNRVKYTRFLQTACCIQFLIGNQAVFDDKNSLINSYK